MSLWVLVDANSESHPRNLRVLEIMHWEDTWEFSLLLHAIEISSMAYDDPQLITLNCQN